MMRNAAIFTLFVICFVLPVTEPHAQTQTQTIRVEAWIDGRSQLILQANTAQWFHLDYAAPGRIDFANEPTVVNGVEWFPVWPDIPDAENRDCQCFSDIFTGVNPPLPQTDAVVDLRIIQSRSETTIVQLPTASNDFTLTIEFNDDGPSGADWYIVEIDFTIAPAQTCVPPPAGLVSWWPGEGDAMDIADANHGTLQGGATFAPGMVGQAFSFDSIDDFVQGNTTTGFPLGSSPRTITAWIKTTGSGIIFHYGVGNADFPPTNFHLLLWGDGRAGVGNGFDYGIAFGTTFLSDDQFHFLAGVYEGSATNIARIYVDGIEEGSAIITTPGTLSGAFTIGQELPEAHQIPFPGLIDEVDIYNRALSSEEIAAIFHAGSAGKCKEGAGGVGGSVTGLQPALIVCENLTTEQVVVIWEQAPSWNCETAGLEVTPDDLIRITIVGGAQ